MSIIPAPDPISGYTYLPVPTPLVPAVMKYLVALESPTRDEQIPSAPAPEPIEKGTGPWTDNELGRLCGMTGKTFELLRDYLDVLAEDEDGEWYSTSDLVERTGRDYNIIKNFPTQTNRVLGAHFDGKPRPGESAWGTNMNPPRDGQMYFRLTPEQSRQWKRMRA